MPRRGATVPDPEATGKGPRERALRRFRTTAKDHTARVYGKVYLPEDGALYLLQVLDRPEVQALAVAMDRQAPRVAVREDEE